MQSSLFPKFAALASALLMGAAFISYRAGGLDRSRSSDRAPIDPPPAQAVQSTVPSAPRQAEAAPSVPPAPTAPAVPDRAFFAGSKSAAVFVESPPASVNDRVAPPATSPPNDSAVIMSGSKSLMPAAPRQKAVQSFQKAGKR
jgi:hypothetical protein